MPIADPSGRRAGGTLRPELAAAVMVGEGHAPLWQYFSRLPSHSSSSAHPKTSAPSAVVDFSCKSLTFEGAEAGAMGAIIDPRSRGQSRLVRELGAEAMPPLWQYLFSP